MASPGVHFSLPPASLFRFPPLADPAPLAPPPPYSFPSTSSSLLSLFAPPFAIPQHVYAAALDLRVPLTIAALYAAAAKALNAYNRHRRAANGGAPRPWRITRTRAFSAFVMAHNILLAAYSAWTFCGMLRGLVRSIAPPDWTLAGGGAGSPWTTTAPWVSTVDSLCRMHGPTGLSAAPAWDEAAGAWEYLDPARGLSRQLPEPAQGGDAAGGRFWNESLAFYGWIFYLSKFYEVVDTLVILAKGKQSSVLQTYHHAGAMLAMWAGIRYMSAPIWMFVLVNSGIHALMYTYYTLAALSVPVPTAVKRTLTTMQISQFLVGEAYAVVHLFVSYTVPVAPAAAVHRPGEDTTRQPPAAEGRSAGENTILGRLESMLGSVVGAAGAGILPVEEATKVPRNAETTYVTRPCITTSGATFAICLNVMYLVPLTCLFVNFFVKSYLRLPSETATKKGGGGGAGRLGRGAKAVGSGRGGGGLKATNGAVMNGKN